jgi:uncharacterized membrane protein YccC
MTSARSRFASLVAFDFSQADWRDAVRGTVVTAAVTSIPVLEGDLAKAIPLSIGAAFIAICEAGQPFSHRWRTMLWTTAALMIAVYLGSAMSDFYLLAIAATGVLAFVCGAVGFLGPRVAVGGLLSLVLFTIYVGVPVPLDDAFTSAALVGLGGLIQAAASVAMGAIRGQHRPPQPERVPFPPASDLWRGEHTFLRHGIRLAVTMMIATAISESVSLPHPYWLPMSVAWMSKPDHDGTAVRVLHRMVGTIVGLMVAYLIVIVFNPSGGGFLPAAIVGVALAIAFIWANYATAVAGVTLWVVSLFAMVGDPVATTMDARLLATAAAAVLVVLAASVSDWVTIVVKRRDEHRHRKR